MSDTLVPRCIPPPKKKTMMWGYVFSAHPPTSLQTRAIFDGPIPSLFSLCTTPRTKCVHWTVECDRCILDLDRVIESEWLCTAINLPRTHYDISYNAICSLAGQSQQVSRGCSIFCPSCLLSGILWPSLLRTNLFRITLWSVLDLLVLLFYFLNPFGSAYEL